MSRNFFNRSITLNKNNIDAVYGLSNVLFEENKFDEAMKFLEEAKKDNPTNINVILLIAQIYERIKEFNKAINEYNYLLSFSPNNFQAILSLSIIENTIGKCDSACERLISLNKEHSNDVKVLMNLSKALLKLKRIDECMKWVEHALTLYNKNTYLYEIYMECLDKKADYNKLETVCRETLRVDKKNAKAIAMLIKSYQKNQKLKELESLLEKINSKLKNKNIQEDYSKKIQNKLDNIVKTTKLEQFEFEKRKKLIIPEEDIQSKMVKLENSVSQNTNESETARHVDMLKKDSSNKDSIFYLAIVFFKVIFNC
jgi:tetratricopeptide (TPR) repeat protein